MKICELKSFGVYDTSIALSGKKRTDSRTVKYFEIEYYIGATGKAVINGQVIDIAPGTLLCGKPGQIRSSIPDFKCYYMHVHFSNESPYKDMLEQAPTFFQMIDRSVYEEIFERLTAHILSEGYDEHSDLINARLLELFYNIRKDSQKNINCDRQMHRERYKLIQSVLEYVSENYKEPLTLKDMADIVGYSPNYFHHVFRSIMGKTPQEYLLEERLKRAKWYLIQTEKTLSEIAYECGFSSQSHLCARFKENIFCTPGEYRRRNLNSYHA